MSKPIRVNAIKVNKKNPRFISENNFGTLCNLIEKYPKFLEKRPIIIDSWDNPVILAGNMRFQAIKKLGYKEIPASWILTADNLSPEEKEAFMLIDNNNLGQWDFDMLANEFDISLLDDLAIFIPNLNVPNSHIDEEGIEEAASVSVKPTKSKETIDVTISFSPQEFDFFNQHIYTFGKTMEAGIIALLKTQIDDVTTSKAVN